MTPRRSELNRLGSPHVLQEHEGCEQSSPCSLFLGLLKTVSGHVRHPLNGPLVLLFKIRLIKHQGSVPTPSRETSLPARSSSECSQRAISCCPLSIKTLLAPWRRDSCHSSWSWATRGGTTWKGKSKCVWGFLVLWTGLSRLHWCEECLSCF